jgi:hypothetical protein
MIVVSIRRRRSHVIEIVDVVVVVVIHIVAPRICIVVKVLLSLIMMTHDRITLPKNKK